MAQEHIYTPLVVCLNCDLYQEISISKGKRIADELCPNCRCKEEIRLALNYPDIARRRTITKYTE